MNRLCLALVAALAALVLPTSASGAIKAGPEVSVSTIEVKGSNGYKVEVSSGRVGKSSPRVGVTVAQEPLTASYSVPEEPGAGLQATFGSLGELDVRFERRGKSIERPEPGCRWIRESGVFRGSFDFVGEDGYVSAHAVDPKGEVFRLPNGFCGLESFRLPRPFIPGLHETVLGARMVDGARVITFKAARLKQAQTVVFSASSREQVGPMKVERMAVSAGSREAFFHTNARRASVFPPPPFSGSAKFDDPGAGPATWAGSLAISFLGAPDTMLAGEAFIAKLCPWLPLLGRCLQPLRDRSIRSRPGLYGSGSHSQPLALARLSSLR